MKSIAHLLSSETAAAYRLPASDWEVAVGKFKTPFGRRVVVGVRHKPSGRQLCDTVVGANLSKRDLDQHAARLVSELAARLGYQNSGSKKQKRHK